MQNIALIGKIGSGKDTAAAALIAGHGYCRVAFADPLKCLVVEADPLVKYEVSSGEAVPVHLSDILTHMSFEEAKRAFPEVRRSLQRIGQGARRIDPDYWVNMAMRTIDGLAVMGMPVVVTDVRYPNEVAALESRGFLTVRVVSNRQETSDHESETALDHVGAAYTILNNGTRTELSDALRHLI